VAGESDDPVRGLWSTEQLKDVMEREVWRRTTSAPESGMPEFKAVNPTTENIAVAIWRRLDGKIPGARGCIGCGV